MQVTPRFNISAIVALLLAAAAIPEAAAATLVTLTSPDGKWSLRSDEFGAYGMAAGADVSFAKRDFGSGLTNYSWASSMMFNYRSTWVTGIDLGLAGHSLLSVANVIYDVTAGNKRTSAFNISRFDGNVEVDLVQTVSNSGITQEYALYNNSPSERYIDMTWFHDVDLSKLGDSISEFAGMLKVSEGGRDLFFTSDMWPDGYFVYLAGIVPTGGVTGNLDVLAYNNYYGVGAPLNQFREISNGHVGANLDANGDKVSDTVGDVGYLSLGFRRIPGYGAASLTVRTLAVAPEPSSALLCLFGLSLIARRRR
jgi:hypothetical protein